MVISLSVKGIDALYAFSRTTAKSEKFVNDFLRDTHLLGCVGNRLGFAICHRLYLGHIRVKERHLMILFDFGLIKVVLIGNKCADEPCDKRPIHSHFRRSRREVANVEKQTFIISTITDVLLCSLLVKLRKD